MKARILLVRNVNSGYALFLRFFAEQINRDVRAGFSIDDLTMTAGKEENIQRCLAEHEYDLVLIPDELDLAAYVRHYHQRKIIGYAGVTAVHSSYDGTIDFLTNICTVAELKTQIERYLLSDPCPRM